MPSRSNLRLVSFDGGGGARTFSQLRILRTIMHRLKHDEHSNEPDKVMLPCEHFDLMGGSGTGGLVVIMFSKLRMSVEEVTAEFLTIVEEVYEPAHSPPVHRTRKLRECMENLMKKKDLPVGLKLHEKTQIGSCPSFVLASHRTSATSKVALRSYSARSHLPSNITVIDAVLATCATHPDFAPVSCGSDHDKREYIAVGPGGINPTRDVTTEALELFGGQSSVAFLLSLGTGKPSIIPVPEDGQVDPQAFMHAVMNDCEQRAQDMERQIGGVGIYFRFSVEQGMQNSQLGSATYLGWVTQKIGWLPSFGLPAERGMQSHHVGEAAGPSWIETQADVYLSDHGTSKNIDGLLKNFNPANACITLEQLEYVAGASVDVQSKVTLGMILDATNSIKEDALLAELKTQGVLQGLQVSGCMEGTRQDILAAVKEWMTDFDATNILWLKGHPGVGKSAIAMSIVEHLRDSNRLGSSFFFQRQEATVTTPSALWRTVAYNLARRHPGVRARIIAALQADESISTIVDVEKLFKQLVHEPLMATEDIPSGRLPIIVIDALDECGGLGGQYSKNRKDLVRTLASWARLPRQFKLFVTSRGEDDIERLFSTTNHRLLEIHTGRSVNPQSLEDVRSFLKHEFQEIAARFSRFVHPDWPGDEVMNTLSSRAAGLFIWARTVVNFVTEGVPPHQLKLVLDGSGAGDIDALYGLILGAAFPNPSEEVIKAIHSVIGTIILARRPLPVDSVTQLLAIDPWTVEYICKGLHSVLEHGEILSVTHQSFVDFMVDPKRCPPMFLVSREQEQQNLTLACLKTMTKELKFNICELETSCVANTEIDGLDKLVDLKIPDALQYSCMHWSSHLCSDFNPASTDVSTLLDEFFTGPRPLYWIEVMSLMGKVPMAISGLREIKGCIKKFQGRQNEAVDDILRFLLAFITPISTSTPHIYISALPFMPTDSRLWKNASGSLPNVMNVFKGRNGSWPTLPGTWLGHTSAVRSVAYSRDGRYVVSGSEDSTVRIWDAETGGAVGQPLRGHNAEVYSVAYSPDSRHIISGSDDKTIRMWDAETGGAVGEPLRGHEGGIWSVAYSPDGLYIASGSADKTIRIWNADTGELVGQPLIGHNRTVYSIAYSPDGQRLASGSGDSTIRIWSMDTGGAVGEPLEGGDEINSVAYSPDGQHIISGSDDYTIRIWDAETGGAVGEPLRGHEGIIWSVAYSPDGRYVVSGSGDRTIRIWDAQTREAVVQLLRGHNGAVYSIAYSPDGRHTVTASADNMIRIWDAETGKALGQPPGEHTGSIFSVAYSPDGRRLVTGSDDRNIQIWDSETGDAVGGPLRGHTGRIRSVTYSPDGRFILSSSEDKTIRIWNADSGEAVGEPLRGHTGVVYDVAYSPDGRCFISGSGDKTIRIWNADTGEAVGEPLQAGDEINSVVYSPDGQRVISGSDDKTIRLWDAQTGKAVGEPFRGHTERIWCVKCSPDGLHIVSASTDETIRIWDATTGEVVGEPLKGHTWAVCSVAYSPDGHHIISGSTDSTIQIWNAQTGKAVGETLRGHTERIWCVKYSPDGLHFASSSEDKTTRIWDAKRERIPGERELAPDASDLPNNTGAMTHTLPNNRASVTALSSHPIPQDMLDTTGYVRNTEGILFWVPEDCRNGLTCPAIMTIPNTGHQKCVRVDLTNFQYGDSWTNVYKGV